jgi:hypothetical protein
MRKGLVSRGVFVIDDAKDIAIVRPQSPVAEVEVIANGIDSLAGSIGRHIDWLQALVSSRSFNGYHPTAFSATARARRYDR